MTQKTATDLLQRTANENVIEFPQHRLAPSAKPSLSLLGTVNRNELTSITALASYVAHNKNVPESTVRGYLMAEFKVQDMASLRRDDYERVIRFLVDLQIDLIIN